MSLAEPIVSLSEAQAYVRIETGEEEAVVAGLIRVASGLCEAFINQIVIARPFECMLPASGCWERLSITPVRSIGAVAGMEDGPLVTPPASPAIGDAYIVDLTPTGDWAGRPASVAAYTSGGWRFVAPFDGISLYVKSQGLWANYRAGAWEMGLLRGSSVIIGGQQVVGSRAAAIASASGGATVDTEARATIDQILAAMRQHGLIES
jgi:hypothetical protein